MIRELQVMSLLMYYDFHHFYVKLYDGAVDLENSNIEMEQIKTNNTNRGSNASQETFW